MSEQKEEEARLETQRKYVRKQDGDERGHAEPWKNLERVILYLAIHAIVMSRLLVQREHQIWKKVYHCLDW